jgi:hypothetical protein
MVQSSSNAMCVEFRSDCATTSTGWEASWKALIPGSSIPEIATEIGAYPNPTSGMVTICTEDLGYSNLTVYDLYCNQMVPLIRYHKSVAIDTSSWPSGVYIVNYGTTTKMGKAMKLVKL